MSNDTNQTPMLQFILDVEAWGNQGIFWKFQVVVSKGGSTECFLFVTCFAIFSHKHKSRQMSCRTIKSFVFPASMLGFVKGRVAKMHNIVEEVIIEYL